uniref:Uncharacterized protein n=1 Tax=Triticum urartu TaxID=4572 RepID=A0A8R7Q801_TRIUA
MEIFTPRTQMADCFCSADIPNPRIRYANDMFFSPMNSCDKSFVTDFYRDGEAMPGEVKHVRGPSTNGG